jgi:protein-L-isoaspartate(D-aspartate) O-methyltransferase
MVTQLKERGITDARLLAAMQKLPRQWFCPDTLLDTLLYDIDCAIQIDCNQTISKPYTVAWQTQLLQLQPLMTVLEVGTGSGYQTAVLCEMGARVYTVERQSVLFRKTKALLGSLHYTARCFLGDCFNGLPEMKGFQYDRILVTCGAASLPTGLMQMLKTGGVMVIPIGPEGNQRMHRITKKGETPDLWHDETLGDANFVPMLEGKNFL